MESCRIASLLVLLSYYIAGASETCGATNQKNSPATDITNHLADLNTKLRMVASTTVNDIVDQALSKAAKPLMAKLAGVNEGDLFPESVDTQTSVEGDLIGGAAWEGVSMQTEGFLDGEAIVASYSRKTTCLLKKICEQFYFITNMGRYGKFETVAKDGQIEFPTVVKLDPATQKSFPLTKEYVALAERVIGGVNYPVTDAESTHEDENLWAEFMSVYRELHTGTPDIHSMEIALENIKKYQHLIKAEGNVAEN